MWRGVCPRQSCCGSKVLVFRVLDFRVWDVQMKVGGLGFGDERVEFGVQV